MCALIAALVDDEGAKAAAFGEIEIGLGQQLTGVGGKLVTVEAFDQQISFVAQGGFAVADSGSQGADFGHQGEGQVVGQGTVGGDSLLLSVEVVEGAGLAGEPL